MRTVRGGPVVTKRRNIPAITAFVRGLAATLVLREILIGSVVWLFVWGSAIVVLRSAFGVPRGTLLWGAAGFLPAWAVAAVRAGRRMPPARAVRALLDDHSACGGLLMAQDQTELGAWEATLPAVVAPRVLWRGRRTWGLLAAGCFFAGVGLLLPEYCTGRSGRAPLEIGATIENLQAQVEVLEEEEIFEEDRAKELVAKLKEVWSESSAADPTRTWEALDHVQATVDQAAQEAIEDLLRRAERVSELEALVRALAGQTGADGALAGLNGERLTEAMRELAAIMARQGLDDAFPGEFDAELAQACRDLQLDPAQLAALAEHLRACQADLSELAARLCEAGLLDAEVLRMCESCLICGDEELAAFLSRDGECDLLKLLVCAGPGKGGISRGRGDAPMTWSAGTSEAGASFREQVLSPAGLAGLKDSRLAGVSRAAPAESGEPAAARPGALEGAATGGGSAHRQRLLPKHRHAVNGYFKR